MNYNFELEIPEMNEEVGRNELEMPVTYGVITKVIIVVPPGHDNLTGLRIFYHESQLYPLNRAGYYHGDSLHIEFDEYQPLIVEPFELKAKGWNADEKLSHTFIMNFTVLRPEEIGREIPVVSELAVRELLGIVGEV
ncbi:unnamed protein product [marine sediment metagenome]|uniref:Uncharacterized protein n=1 Tax=marine sediment metagenome TaxID=412755 RepID=X1F2S8_9ZZZZ